MIHIKCLSQLNSFPVTTKEFSYDLKSTRLFSRFRRSLNESRCLIVYFHGALERSKRAIPSYYPIDPEISGHAHQISICDPTMTSREGFPISWYAGHEDFNCQEELKCFFQQLKEELGIRKIIFFGSSGGGFASLFYSFFDEDSVAMALVPQTKIKNYHRPKAFEMYSKSCWSEKPISEVENYCCLDVCELYKSGFKNSVVYIQSSGDVEHFSSQLIPFLSSINHCKEHKENFILENSYFGKFGHSGVIQKSDYSPLLMSLIFNDLKDKESILADFYKFRQDTSSHNKRLGASEKAQVDNTELDLQKSQIIYQYLMK